MSTTYKDPSNPFIDADSHIEEHADVFKHLDSRYDHRRPIIVDVGGAATWNPQRNKLWLIDGEVRPKLWGQGNSCYGTPVESDFAAAKPVTRDVQGLLDPKAYCASVDEIGLDVAVIYSTLFLHPVTQDPFYEAALMSAYNSYMSETCGVCSDRIKWAALIPMACPELAVKEVERARALGASTLMVLGTVHGEMLHLEKFNPVFEKIQASGMPISVHVGWSHKGIEQFTDSIAASIILNFEMSAIFGFYSFVAGGILDRFPGLRVAFVEAGANWFPVALERIAKWHKTNTAKPWPAKKSPYEYIRDHQVYFTVEGDESNLIDFIKLVGTDRILGAADFPHVHYEGGQLSSAFHDLRELEGLTDKDRQKIFGLNAQHFYGFR